MLRLSHGQALDLYCSMRAQASVLAGERWWFLPSRRRAALSASQDAAGVLENVLEAARKDQDHTLVVAHQVSRRRMHSAITDHGLDINDENLMWASDPDFPLPRHRFYQPDHT